MRGLARMLLAIPLLGFPAAPSPCDESRAGDPAELRHEDAIPPGPSVEDRLAEIRRRIEAALVYPPLARWRDADGEARVRFRIDAAGRARDVAVVRSSGRPALDAAAARAVVDAGMLPRVEGPLEVPVRFELRPRPPSDRAAGAASRRAGGLTPAPGAGP